MSVQGDERIAFEVETSRILEILSKEIYDSPLALLRENVQNAYDAVLMRATQQQQPLASRQIEICVETDRVTVSDDGIGMTEDILRLNFWKAGASGKRTDLARRSGVIGTFGIGAMANFGVCNRLTVETRSLESDTTLISVAERESLAISKECISLRRVIDARPPGTKITADLDEESRISPEDAKSYLTPYVRFLPVRVVLNGDRISQQSLESVLGERADRLREVGNRDFNHGIYTGHLAVFVDPDGRVVARVTCVGMGEMQVQGELLLGQGMGPLMGFRNFFGLAPVPVNSYYDFGGVANLSILEPTAGREALSRESIEYVSELISLADHGVSEELSRLDDVDRNSAFIEFIASKNRLDLAGNITIEVLPERGSVRLRDVGDFVGKRRAYYYVGREQDIINTFASNETPLLHVSQNNPRRKVQLRYLTTILHVQEVPNYAQVRKRFDALELTMAEAAFLIRLANTLNEDYLIESCEVALAEVTHGVPVLVNREGDILRIYVARDSSALRQVLQVYESAYELFGAFIKDFVRSNLYQLIAQYVPSSTRQGADALFKILQRNRELYRVEEGERGELECLLDELLKGDASLGDTIRRARRIVKAQTQRVRQDQMGGLEVEMPDIVQSPAPRDTSGLQYVAAPAIMRPDTATTMKILTTDHEYPQLNNFRLFLGLSDRLFRRDGDFFRWPHTTKVIWAAHRVTYIFGDAIHRLTLYYDIELTETLESTKAGGMACPTTTIFTKSRIFVPVPTELVAAFEVQRGTKEFYVRFDILTG